MNNIYEEYRQRLVALAEPAYKDFNLSLMPGTDNLLGVRMPALRKLAKELAQGDWREYFERNRDRYFEETMLQGMTIGCLKEDLETVLEESRKFLPKISNWALCDSFCAGLKIARENKECFWELIGDCIRSDKPYYIRFAVVMMLEYFIDETYLLEMLLRLDGVENDDYYVKMAVAWAVSMCYVKFPGTTLKYLKDCRLSDFTYNKALQKICESFVPSENEKAQIRSMKRPVSRRKQKNR